MESAINHFASDLQIQDKLMIRECLKLIQFGIANALLTFGDKHFEHDGDRDVQNKGLTIGGGESAWLVDQVAACLLENTAACFKSAACDGMCRDDGVVVMNGDWSKNQIINWLNIFKSEVNRVTRYEGLQFTISTWGVEKEDDLIHKKITVEPTPCLPFLDMQLFWNDKDELSFNAHMQEGQAL
jgi:hypothetical protein